MRGAKSGGIPAAKIEHTIINGLRPNVVRKSRAPGMKGNGDRRVGRKSK